MMAEKKKFNLPFYVAFIIATIGITKFFTSHHYFTAGDSIMGYTVVVVSLLAFFLSCFYMAFVVYCEEKEKDNLRVNWSIFEYLYKRFKAK